MRLAHRLNHLFASAIVTSVLISLVFYFVLSLAHRKHAFETAKLRVQSIFEGQLPFLTQELVNDRYYAALLRGEALIKESGANQLEIGLYRPDGTPIFESQAVKDVLGPAQHSPSVTGVTRDYAYVLRKVQFGDDDMGRILFALKVDLSGEELLRKPLLASMIILLSSLLLLFFLVRRSLTKLVVNPLQKITNAIPKLGAFIQGKSEEFGVPTDLKSSELNMVATTLSEVSNELKHSLQREQNAQLQIERERAISQVARQVAHDIRSPLAALEFICGNLPALPEDKRILIRSATSRVQDIANDLLGRSRIRAALPTGALPQLVFYLIDQVASEKRIEYRKRFGVEILTSYEGSSYSAFAILDATVFKRVLSNLIDNAVQAIEAAGTVRVTLEVSGNQIKMCVKDSGRGIPAEILPKLAQEGFSYAKKNGSGIGLFHAKQSIESWGGELIIESELGVGTKIKLSFPECEAPLWFVSELSICRQEMLVIVDDDSSIHEIWDKRFSDIKLSDPLIHFTSAKDFSHWVENEPTQLAFFLIDYEFLAEEFTGVDLIRKYNLEKRSILVTSRFDEIEVLEKCKKYGLRVLPKGLAGFVPIYSHLNKNPDAILLDDDSLVQQVWRWSALSNDKNLRAFTNPDRFLEEIEKFPKDCPVFLDVHLGKFQNGLQVAPQVLNLGFQEVYLITGELPEAINVPFGITGVLGKSPPWGNLTTKNEKFTETL